VIALKKIDLRQASGERETGETTVGDSKGREKRAAT